MNLQIETRLSDQLAQYVNLAANQAKLTANNMANIDTPGYHTKGLDFDAEMRSALQASDEDKRPGPTHVLAVDGLVARPDGNNVSMDREGLKLAESQLKFRTGVALLKHEFQNVLNAIHSDK